MIPKPFDIDQFVSAIHTATGRTPPTTDAEEAQHLEHLLGRLRAASAAELQGSKIGLVWVTFRAGQGRSIHKIYRWRVADVYFVGRYDDADKQLEPLAEFSDFDALMAFCLMRIEGCRVR